MTPDELTKPTVPVAYVLLTLQMAEERGISREAMLKDLDWLPALLEQPDTRLGLLKYGQLCIRAMKLASEPAMGYEFGLRNNITIHGFYGFGVMSQATVRDAVEFAVRFAPLRLPGWSLKFFIEGKQCVLEAHEAVPFGILRQYALDMLLVSLVTSFRQSLTPTDAGLELWFDCAEPDYYQRYRERLPKARFSTGTNQIRFAADTLGRPLPTANAVTARLVARECEREIAMLGHTEDLLERVRATLINDQGRYPDLESVSRRLYMSSRTLKRRLQQHGISFLQLRDEARHRDSIRLLEDPTLSLEAIAARLGYSTPANFSRAFVKWTGSTPGSFRKQLRG